LTLTRRLSDSFRVGLTTQNYKAPGESSTSSPYAETTLNYILTKFSTVSWDARYGYDDGSSAGEKSKSARTGVVFTHAFTPKIHGSVGVNYSHTDSSQTNAGLVSAKQDAIDATVGATYAFSQSLSFFTSVTHTRRTSSSELQDMTKNLYYLGASYQY